VLQVIRFHYKFVKIHFSNETSPSSYGHINSFRIYRTTFTHCWTILLCEMSFTVRLDGINIPLTSCLNRPMESVLIPLVHICNSNETLVLNT
jgi:hypothetical protein